MLGNNHFPNLKLPKEIKRHNNDKRHTLHQAQVLCLLNELERNCPLLPLNPGTLDLLYVDNVGGEKNFSCLPKSHILK
jgi:hypothetical protein